MFRSTAIIRELVLSLAKVMLQHLCPYRLCGGVAAYLGSGVCVLCAVHNTQHKTETCRSDVYVNFSVKIFCDVAKICLCISHSLAD
jgi:hypothetical protein